MTVWPFSPHASILSSASPYMLRCLSFLSFKILCPVPMIRFDYAQAIENQIWFEKKSNVGNGVLRSKLTRGDKSLTHWSSSHLLWRETLPSVLILKVLFFKNIHIKCLWSEKWLALQDRGWQYGWQSNKMQNFAKMIWNKISSYVTVYLLRKTALQVKHLCTQTQLPTQTPPGTLHPSFNLKRKTFFFSHDHERMRSIHKNL